MTCSPRTKLCVDEFTGNTMVQHDTRGWPLFLHSNLHKVTLGGDRARALPPLRTRPAPAPGACLGFPSGEFERAPPSGPLRPKPRGPRPPGTPI